MYAKRIIPCLDVKNGRVVKGMSFVNLVDAGDPVESAMQYDKQGADELVFLGDAHRLLDALEHADLEVGDLLAVADDADDRAVLTGRQMCLEADLMQALLDFLDVLFRGIWFHDNDHNDFLLTIPRRIEKARPSTGTS